MTNNNLLRELYQSMEMTLCRPKSGGARSMGINSVATAAAKVSGGSRDDGH